jgi:hypothetical protein
MQGRAVISDWDEFSNAIGPRGISMWGGLWVTSNRHVTLNIEINVGRNMMNLRMGEFWKGDRDMFWQVYQFVDGLFR